MKGIFIHDTRSVPYALAIAQGYKTIETRFRDVLGRFVGQRVNVIRTRSGRPAEVVGSVVITGKWFCRPEQFDEFSNRHCIPTGSRYDCHGRGKWCYDLSDPVALDHPVPLSSFRVSHKTRSFAIIDA